MRRGKQPTSKVQVQVPSTEEWKKLLLNLPGRHMYSYKSLSTLFGCDPDSSQLQMKLKAMLGPDWKITLDVSVLLKQRILFFPSGSMRCQNELASAGKGTALLRYDPLAMMSFRSMLLANKDEISLMISSFHTRQNQTEEHITSVSGALSHVADIIFPLISKVQDRTEVTQAGILVSEMHLWEDAPLRVKLALLSKTCLELAQNGVLNPIDFGLSGEINFIDPSWSSLTLSAAVVHKLVFVKFCAPLTARTVDAEESDEPEAQILREQERVYVRRQALRAPLHLFLKPESLEQEASKLEFIMLAEVVLSAPTYEAEIVDDNERLLGSLRRFIFECYKGTDITAPIQFGRHLAGEVGDSIIFCYRELDRRFNKHSDRLRDAFMKAVSARRMIHASTLVANFSLPPLKEDTLLDWRRSQITAATGILSGGTFGSPVAKSASHELRSSSPSSLSSRRQSSSPLGGRPGVTDAEIAAIRHTVFAGGVSFRKSQLVTMTSGFYFLGRVPSLTEVLSPATLLYGILRLKSADDCHDARLLNSMLIAHPNACISFSFDCTVSGTSTRQSIFLRGPFPPEGNLSIDVYPEHRSVFLGFPFVPSKGARSLAEMTIRRLKEWAAPVPLLFERALIAFVNSTVDHAALPEANQVIAAADIALSTSLSASGKTLDDFASGTFTEVMRTATGDSFHKSSLVAAKVEVSGFGRARGSKVKRVISATQLCLDANYYESKGDSRQVVQWRLTYFMGRQIPVMRSLVSQRWESTGKAFSQMIERLQLPSQRFNGMFLPDFYISELPQFTESQYQFDLLSRLTSGLSNPLIVLVHFNLPIDILEQYWKGSNLTDRANSSQGSPQGFCLREYLECLVYVHAPYWETAPTSLAIAVPKTFSGIDDLRFFAIYYYVTLEGVRRFTVSFCVLLERHRLSSAPGLVKLNDYFTVDILKMELVDTSGEETIICKVRREDYFVHLRDTTALPDEIDDEEVVGNAGGLLSVNDLADRAIKQVKHGLEQGRSEFRKWTVEYYRPPKVIGFITVPGFAGAASRWLFSVILRTRPELLPPTARMKSPLIGDAFRSPRDRWFNSLLVPTPEEAAKGVTLASSESNLVKWVVRFGLLHSSLLLEWKALCNISILCDTRGNDLAAAHFGVSFPLLNCVLGRTLDNINQTNYINEQTNGILETITRPGSSMAVQEAAVAYFINVLKSVNDETRWLAVTEEKVLARRRKGEHVRLRAIDSGQKCQEHVRLIMELCSRRYSPANMSSIQSRADFAKQGTKYFDAATVAAVLEVSVDKKKNHILTLEAIEQIRKHDQGHELEFDSNYFGAKTESPMDIGFTMLSTEKFWSSVADEDFSLEVKKVLPHAFALMQKQETVFNVITSWSPQCRSLWNEDDPGEDLDDPQRDWCLPTCHNRRDASTRMIYCEGGSCLNRCFHLRCVGLSRIPSGCWLCIECKRMSTTFIISAGRSVQSVLPSVIWHPKEKYSKTTFTRQKSVRFQRKQIRGYVSIWFMGRNTKTVGLKGPAKQYEPLTQCPACRCRHAGGIRCYLSADEDDAFLTAFIQPLGKTLSKILRDKKKTAEGTSFVDLDGYGPSSSESDSDDDS